MSANSFFVKKSLGVSLVIGLILSVSLNLVFGFNYSFDIGKLSKLESQSFTIVLVAIASVVFLFSDHGKDRIKLLILSLFFGSLVSLVWVDYFNVSRAITTGMFYPAAYAGFCLLQSYHASGYCRPSYLFLFASVWNTLFISLLSLVFLGLVKLLITLCALIFFAFNLKTLTLFLANQHVAFTLYPIALSCGYYLASRSQKLVFVAKRILLGFLSTLLPFFTLVAWLFIFLLLSHWVFQTAVALSDVNFLSLSLGIGFFGLVLVNAMYVDGQSLAERSKCYRLFVVLLCCAMVCLFVLSFVLYLGGHVAYSLISDSSVLFYLLIILSLSYAVTYLYASLNKTAWMLALEEVNFRLAWVLILLSVLFHSPLAGLLYERLPKEPVDMLQSKHRVSQQEELQRAQATLSQAGLTWGARGDSSIILGYRHEMPLGVCQANDPHPVVGVADGHHCVVIHEQGKVSIYHSYQALVGDQAHLSWVSVYDKDKTLLFYDDEKKAQVRICRTILHSRIYVGLYQEFMGKKASSGSEACQVVVSGRVEQIVGSAHVELLGY